MKRILFLFIGLSFMIPEKVKAQNHEIQTNMLGLFVNNVSIGYERLMEDKGWFSNVQYYKNPKNSDYDFTVLSINTEFRFYFRGNDASGFFAGPYLNYAYASAPEFDTFLNSNNEYSKVKATSGGIALGVITGKKWVHHSGFVFGTNAGIGRYFSHSVNYSDNYTPLEHLEELNEVNPFSYRLGINIGYRF